MSNNPYRTMCADMLEAFDGLPCETNYRGQSRPIVCIDEEPFDRARALLAQPELPELTDAAAWDLADDLGIIRGDSGDLHVSFAGLGSFARAALARFDHPTPQPLPSGYIDPEHQGEDLALLETFYRACNAEGGTADEIQLRGIKAVLATHSTPQPPADGEVGYALLELRSLVMGLGYAGMHVDAQRLERAADLLERQHPQPVAVSERLPEAKDCALWPGDPEATPWCWAGKDIDAGWEWAQISMLGLGTDTLSRIIAGGGWTHWLPANALPTPTPEDQP
jgi:hypothetical protein